MKTKILVVEDEAIVAKDISVCLEKIGYEVVATFSKGEKALTFLENNSPDLVLMDIMLAGDISGIDASASPAVDTMLTNEIALTNTNKAAFTV